MIGVSQRSVQLVIGRLLTDADFRRGVNEGGSAYLARLRTQGVALSREEVAALIEKDPRVWANLAKRIDLRSPNAGAAAGREDPQARPLLTGVVPGDLVIRATRVGYRAADQSAQIEPGDNRQSLLLQLVPRSTARAL